MTIALTSLSPAEVRQHLAKGGACLVDIREADEFARRRIKGALSSPLSAWDESPMADWRDGDVVFTCRSGMRTASAAPQLASGVAGTSYVLAGGVDAWEAAGLPLEVDKGAPLEIMRQVQIAAGLLVLAGVTLGYLAAPLWFGLAAFVGAGLTFAGLSGYCGMAKLLMLAPWNRRANPV
jgi:rhodanese-related sulfurtransferase